MTQKPPPIDPLAGFDPSLLADYEAAAQQLAQVVDEAAIASPVWASLFSKLDVPLAQDAGTLARVSWLFANAPTPGARALAYGLLMGLHRHGERQAERPGLVVIDGGKS